MALYMYTFEEFRTNSGMHSQTEIPITLIEKETNIGSGIRLVVKYTLTSAIGMDLGHLGVKVSESRRR